MLCASDCEPLTMPELLGHADGDALQRWQSLWLGYTETRGLPALREAIAELYNGDGDDDDDDDGDAGAGDAGGGVTAEQVLVLAPEEGERVCVCAFCAS